VHTITRIESAEPATIAAELGGLLVGGVIGGGDVGVIVIDGATDRGTPPDVNR